jgi:hypothetical protein
MIDAIKKNERWFDKVIICSSLVIIFKNLYNLKFKIQRFNIINYNDFNSKTKSY